MPASSRVAALCLAVVVAAGLASVGGNALAQADNSEARLRDALRRTTVELRTLQDAQAAKDAELADAKSQRDALQAALDEQTGRLVELEARLAAQPQVDVEGLIESYNTLQSNFEGLQATLRKWQDAYQEAASVARTKEGERKRLEGALTRTTDVLQTCQTKNEKLTVVANDVLDLYAQSDFRTTLFGSFEPILGLKRVELETIVQDYQDRILDEEFTVPPGAPAPETNP
jgi:chromosome segregation ATPase